MKLQLPDKPIQIAIIMTVAMLFFLNLRSRSDADVTTDAVETAEAISTIVADTP